MTACWTGPSSAFEQRLLQPMSTYALEQLRQRFLFSLTTDHGPARGARVLFQMAFETEVGKILTKMIDVPSDVSRTTVCERRRFFEVDHDVREHRYLLQPALLDLSNLPTLPPPYVDFLARYLMADYPRFRVCTVAVMLCIAKALQ